MEAEKVVVPAKMGVLVALILLGFVFENYF